MSQLTQIITATDPTIRDRALEDFCRSASLDDLLAECQALDPQSDHRHELASHRRCL